MFNLHADYPNMKRKKMFPHCKLVICVLLLSFADAAEIALFEDGGEHLLLGTEFQKIVVRNATTLVREDLGDIPDIFINTAEGVVVSDGSTFEMEDGYVFVEDSVFGYDGLQLINSSAILRGGGIRGGTRTDYDYGVNVLHKSGVKATMGSNLTVIGTNIHGAFDDMNVDRGYALLMDNSYVQIQDGLFEYRPLYFIGNESSIHGGSAHADIEGGRFSYGEWYIRGSYVVRVHGCLEYDDTTKKLNGTLKDCHNIIRVTVDMDMPENLDIVLDCPAAVCPTPAPSIGVSAAMMPVYSLAIISFIVGLVTFLT